jgi:hypothetical protein
MDNECQQNSLGIVTISMVFAFSKAKDVPRETDRKAYGRFTVHVYTF